MSINADFNRKAAALNGVNSRNPIDKEKEQGVLKVTASVQKKLSEASSAEANKDQKGAHAYAAELARLEKKYGKEFVKGIDPFLEEKKIPLAERVKKAEKAGLFLFNNQLAAELSETYGEGIVKAALAQLIPESIHENKLIFKDLDFWSIQQEIRSTCKQLKTILKSDRSEQAVLQEIQQHVAALDGGDEKGLHAQIQRLKALMKRANETFPHLKTPLDNLSAALDLLIDRQAFMPDSAEKKALEIYRDQIKGSLLDLTSYLKNRTPHANRVKSELLKKIKNTQLVNIKELSLLQTLIGSLKDQALQSRLEDLRLAGVIERAPSQRVANLLILIQAFQDVGAQCTEKLREITNAIYHNYDKKTDGEFSKLIKNYESQDIKRESYLNALAESMMGSFLVELETRGINPNFIENGSLSNHPFLADYSGWMKEKNEEFRDFIRKEFKPAFDWFAKGYIEQPYSQGAHPERNAGNGICDRWSNRVLSVLLKDPEISSKEIPVETEAKEVFVKLMAKAHNDQGAQAVQKKGDRDLGLSEGVWHSITTEQAEVDRGSKKYVTDSLFGEQDKDNIQAMMKSHQGLFVLSYRPKGIKKGHRIAVQFDPSKNLFRFADANVGITRKYPDPESFIEHFQAWLEISYGNYTEFRVGFYSLLEN